MSLGKVYSCGPTFRAEKSKTRRHLTEFWMIEPEAVLFDLAMDIELAQDFVFHIVSEVLTHQSASLELLERDISKLEKVSLPFPTITYDEAVTMLNKIKTHDLEIEPFQWYIDLRKYGSLPHSGFGLGIERTVAWVCGLKHVRETIPFPRLMNIEEKAQRHKGRRYKVLKHILL